MVYIKPCNTIMSDIFCTSLASFDRKSIQNSKISLLIGTI